jgi:PAS domain-containing protein
MESANKPRTSGARRALQETLPWAEARIVLLCVALAGLWIVCSDMALDWLTQDHVHWLRLFIFKGLNFVATTIALLCIVLRRSFNRSRQTEQQLLEIEERFEFAGRAATDAIWDWNLVTDAVWCSEGFYKVFGYTEKDM